MRLSALLPLALIGCAGPSPDPGGSVPARDTSARSGLLRDFFPDGKFDEAGRPLSAHVTEPAEICDGDALDDGAVRLSTAGCDGPLVGSTQRGGLALDVGLWAIDSVAQLPPEAPVATVEILDEADAVLASTVLAAGSVREDGEWMHLSLRWTGGAQARVTVRPTGAAAMALGSLELFPARFRLAVGPGSAILAPESDRISVEWPLDQARPQLELAEVDVSDAVAALVEAGEATEAQTTYRQLLEVPLDGLLAAVAEQTELPGPEAPLALVVRSAGSTARMQIRRAVDPCLFEGDPQAPVKVLVTGFEPFPADAWHENVSGVGVQAMDAANLPGVQLMRLILPVEYDTAAERVVDAIRRCAPDMVIDFGQGGGTVAVEETAYNLKDTGEVPGGAPDNRGVIATATPIEPSGPAELPTGLPLDAIVEALDALGTTARRSDDPGRYICNNVFYRVMQAVGQTDLRAGFVHLPYVTRFDDDASDKWGRTLEAIVRTVAQGDDRLSE